VTTGVVAGSPQRGEVGAVRCGSAAPTPAPSCLICGGVGGPECARCFIDEDTRQMRRADR
jgi:hypothetical protein